MLSQTKHQQECNNQIEAEPLNRVMKHPGSTLYINPVFYLTYSGTRALMENLCSVNLSDISKMLVKKQMKYFDVPSELPCMESSGFTRTFKYKNEKFLC